MADIINLNSRRPLKERFNQAASLINAFDFEAYYKLGLVERETRRNSLQEQMMECIALGPTEVEVEMIQLTINSELSNIFSFMVEGAPPPSRRDIDDAKEKGKEQLISSLENIADNLRLDLNQP